MIPHALSLIQQQQIIPFDSQLAPYHGHKSSSYTNQRAHCYDHHSQLPSADESNHEAKHKCRDPLNEDRHLVSDGIVDLVDITVKEQETLSRVKHSLSFALITCR